MPVKPTPYPPLFRLALLLAVTLGLMQSFSAAQGVGLVTLATSATPAPDVSLGWLGQLTPYAKEQERALAAGYQARLRALDTMAGSRIAILLGLSITASMVCLGALFLRWSRAPRGPTARLLGGAALGAALFRTLDGAQDLAVTRRAAAAMEQALLGAGVPADFVRDSHTLESLSVVSVVWTAMMVGLFLFIGRFFRSERVQTLLGPADADEG